MKSPGAGKVGENALRRGVRPQGGPDSYFALMNIAVRHLQSAHPEATRGVCSWDLLSMPGLIINVGHLGGWTSHDGLNQRPLWNVYVNTTSQEAGSHLWNPFTGQELGPD
ncbi:hypothetical protein WJX72_000099 [[Myrmecia] bisecta]|uniref:Uncharacterized protein n=1 Tax=[Myrmecia] bisecta TaxID=41462 RepID=A0AAW1PRY8_9CHLO